MQNYSAREEWRAASTSISRIRQRRGVLQSTFLKNQLEERSEGLGRIVLATVLAFFLDQIADTSLSTLKWFVACDTEVATVNPDYSRDPAIRGLDAQTLKKKAVVSNCVYKIPFHQGKSVLTISEQRNVDAPNLACLENKSHGSCFDRVGL